MTWTRKFIEETMAYRATAFRSEIMRKPIPQLTFRGHTLIPYDTSWQNHVITLYFEDMDMPADPITWSEQLLEQNFIMVGYGRNESDKDVPFVFVRAMMRGQA